MSQSRFRDVARRLVRLLPLYSVGALSGWLFEWLGMPLPWMIGPLIVVAGIYLAGLADVVVPVSTRPFGQLVVASSIGLFFTPAAFGMLVELMPALVASAFMSAACAFLLAWFQARALGVSYLSAVISTFPMSPAEAATIAERHSIAPAPIVFCQTLRVAAAVILLPLSLLAISGWPDRSGTTGNGMVSVTPEIVVVLVAGAVTAAVFRRVRLANPFFLGPLAAASAITASGFDIPPMPYWLLGLAQLALGVWLGSTFRRDLVEKAHRWLAVAVGTTLLFLLAGSLGALACRVSSTCTGRSSYSARPRAGWSRWR